MKNIYKLDLNTRGFDDKKIACDSDLGSVVIWMLCKHGREDSQTFVLPMVFNGSALDIQLSLACGGCEGGGLWRDAVGRNHGNALFYNVFLRFTVIIRICGR